ncbi:hypothetical protein [Acidovorax sp. Q11]|jgi:hypothetical protein
MKEIAKPTGPVAGVSWWARFGASVGHAIRQGYVFARALILV